MEGIRNELIVSSVAYKPSAGILASDYGHEGTVEVGIKGDIRCSVRARQGEFGDEGDMREHLGVGRRVGRGLHLRILAFLAYQPDNK